jgi:hypothetical protein
MKHVKQHHSELAGSGEGMETWGFRSHRAYTTHSPHPVAGHGTPQPNPAVLKSTGAKDTTEHSVQAESCSHEPLTQRLGLSQGRLP